jgi:hypothetical protein
LFLKLSHIELDTLVLRKKREQVGTTIVYTPPLLINILPKSVQEVRLNVREGGYFNIVYMLQGICSEKFRLPSLHLIAICFIEHHHDTMARLKTLQLEFRDCGIDLELVEWQSEQIDKNIPIIFPKLKGQKRCLSFTIA